MPTTAEASPQLGFMAYDVHELLPHFVARENGLYAEEGLAPVLVDATFLSDDDIAASGYFQVACGSAYLARRRGVPLEVVLASVHQPLFWIVGRGPMDGLSSLMGGALATFPPAAPPHHLLRATLRAVGLDPDGDVGFVPARDDAARLGLLGEGSVQAALVSSAVIADEVRSRGLEVLTCLGDHVTFVSSGLATNVATLEEEPEVVNALVRTLRKALRAISEDRELACRAIERRVAVPPDTAKRSYDVVASRFTRSGQIPIDALEPGLRALEREVPGQPLRASELYRWER